MAGAICNITIHGCITDEQIAIINNAVVSDPASGEHEITDIRFAADGSLIVRYNNVPTP